MTAFADYLLVRKSQSADGGLLPLTSPTTAIASGTKDAAVSVPIGFTFNYDGTDYTTVELTSDGMIRIDGTLSAAQNQNDQFDDANSAAVLAPWWDYLITSSTGYVRYETLGTAPRRYFVADFDCWGRFSHSVSANVRLFFQVVLRESTNNIEFRYGNNSETGSPSYTTTRATIGAKTDTSGTITGNIREFTEISGTPVVNGGIDAPVVVNYLVPQPGAEWPGDPTNTFASEAVNFHFLATPLSLASATATTRNTITATFDADVLSTTVDAVADWTVVPTDGGAPVTVTSVDTVGSTSVVFSVSPGVTPGREYTVTAVNATTTGGTAASPNSIAMTVGGSLVLSHSGFNPDWTFDPGILETLLRVFGQEAQTIGGRLVTKLAQDFGTSDTTAWVESTLAWPSAGSFWCSGALFSYTGKTPNSLTGITSTYARLVSITAGETAHLNSPTLAPSA